MIELNEINNIDINNVIILDTDQAGDIYMEQLYPIWVDCVVFTLEGKYPLNPLLRQKVIDELATNKNVRCILFGAEAEKYPTATEVKLPMAPFFLKDLVRYFWHRPNFEFDQERICEFIKAFCIRRDVERMQRYSYTLNTFEPSSIKWYHQLLK